MSKPQSFFHLHMISDATGETLLAAGRAVSAQYKDARAIEHIFPLIRTEKQLSDDTRAKLKAALDSYAKSFA